MEKVNITYKKKWGTRFSNFSKHIEISLQKSGRLGRPS